ncbi:FUSC family protein [Escherichia coli]|uniref:FUSC family protein n=1 Tax=Escherichia coli TaxID=562 RepID=UPI003D016239
MSVSFRSNGVFLIIAALNSLLCSTFFGEIGAAFGFITTLFSHTIYEARDKEGNIFYIWCLLVMVMLGAGLGFVLKLSAGFYLYLFVISCFYYLVYNNDPYIDRTIPFLIIFSCLGTTLPSISPDLPLAYLSGITLSLLCLALLRRKHYQNDAFRNGLFAHQTYTSDKHIILRAIIYSAFLFSSLALPDYLGLYRVYWAPLTFIVLLRPKEMHILKTTCFRFTGSLLGALFIIALFKTISFRHIPVYFAILAVVTFLLPNFLKMNYIVKTFGITVFVLLLLEETEFLHDPTYLLPFSRVYETLIGGCIAIVASVVLKLFRNIQGNATNLQS